MFLNYNVKVNSGKNGYNVPVSRQASGGSLLTSTGNGIRFIASHCRENEDSFISGKVRQKLTWGNDL